MSVNHSIDHRPAKGRRFSGRCRHRRLPDLLQVYTKSACRNALFPQSRMRLLANFPPASHRPGELKAGDEGLPDNSRERCQ